MTYFERSREVLDLIARTEADVSSSRRTPKGLLRINSSTGFTRQTLLHAIPAFLARFPDISVDVTLTDRLVDPVAEQVDIIIRGSPSAGSDLVVRQLAEGRRLICASPDYLLKYGTPRSAADRADGRNLPPIFSSTIFDSTMAPTVVQTLALEINWCQSGKKSRVFQPNKGETP